MSPVDAAHVLGHEQGLEGALAVARHLHPDSAGLAAEGPAGVSVAGVGGVVGVRAIFFVAEMLGQLGLQGALYQAPGELANESVFGPQWTMKVDIGWWRSAPGFLMLITSL